MTVSFTHLNSLQRPSPAQFVRDAWELGDEINLSGVGYGRHTWHDEPPGISRIPESYYRFLAGASRLMRAKTAIEVGTYWGGSAVSIARGMGADAKLVTVDVSEESDNFLPTQPEGAIITKLVGDSASLEIITQMQAIFRRVDLLYLDADHGLMPTLQNFGIYVSLFRPKIVLVDDIRLSDEMRSFWQMMQLAYPEESIDCLDVEPDIRWADHGFGLILMPEG